VEKPILPPENFGQNISGKTWKNPKKLRIVYISVLGLV